MGRRGRRRGSPRRAEGRVRGRVRERVQGRPGRGGGAGRTGGNLDIGAIEGYARRLGGQVGGTSGLSGAASGLAGAASGLAGGSIAHRFLDSDSEGSEEDFRREIRERLDLIDERLAQLEDLMRTLSGEGDTGDLAEPGGEPDTFSNR